MICSDIDECSNKSHSREEDTLCIDNVGAYSCSCGTGSTDDDATCIENDECSTGADTKYLDLMKICLQMVMNAVSMLLVSIHVVLVT